MEIAKDVMQEQEKLCPVNLESLLIVPMGVLLENTKKLDKDISKYLSSVNSQVDAMKVLSLSNGLHSKNKNTYIVISCIAMLCAFIVLAINFNLLLAIFSVLAILGIFAQNFFNMIYDEVEQCLESCEKVLAVFTAKLNTEYGAKISQERKIALLTKVYSAHIKKDYQQIYEIYENLFLELVELKKMNNLQDVALAG